MHSACLLLLVSYCTLTLGLFAPPTRTPGRRSDCLWRARTDRFRRSRRRRAPRASSPLCAPALALQERVETAKNSHDSHFCKLCEGVRPQVLCWAEQGALPAGCSPLDPLSVGAVAQARRATERTHSTPVGARPGTSRRRRRANHGGLALPPRPDGPRARHARGHVAPGPHHR